MTAPQADPLEQALARALQVRIGRQLSALAAEARWAVLDALILAIAVVLALAAAGFAVAALWWALAPGIGAAGAALAVAVALLLLASAAVWVRRFVWRRTPRVPETGPASPELSDAAQQAFSANKVALMLAALATGAIAADALRK